MPTLYRQAGSPNWYFSIVVSGKRLRPSTGTADKKAAQEYADTFAARSWRQEKLGEQYISFAALHYAPSQYLVGISSLMLTDFCKNLEPCHIIHAVLTQVCFILEAIFRRIIHCRRIKSIFSPHFANPFHTSDLVILVEIFSKPLLF